MTLGEFEKELKKINPNFFVMAGRASDLTAGVFFKQERLFTIPNHNIYDHPIDSYGIETSSGFIRHRTTKDAIKIAKKVLQDLKEGGEDYRAVMGLGEFSDARLRQGHEAEDWQAEQAYIETQKQTKGGIVIP